MSRSLFDRLRAFCDDEQLHSYRFSQIVDHIRGGCELYSDMHRLPIRVRRRLVETFGDDILPLRVAASTRSGQAGSCCWSWPTGTASRRCT